MRKIQKKQAEDFIRLLEQAHAEVKKKIAEGKAEPAQDLLSQCQQGAIELGNLIETTEGEGFVTVSYLEKYCEAVYQIYQEIETVSSANAEKAYKSLRKALLAVENSIRNDIPLKKEVVFFPYKASMWDSLESVYLAAKEDPDCDAYCVPIPYFDKNPDGSLGQMHYEGREYPKNIEVIDWQTYHIEERHPDVVYIHNPYDECNYVTCVHPAFFSSNLKKYTDELVYIPYFVLGEIDPEDQKTIDQMKHFCFLPGTIYADKVIVQSEAMRRIYINEYLKEAKAHGMHATRKELEGKFLGLGSPKFDKVLNTKKEDLEIPDEWLRIIQKPDGSRKKIIFYNTSITALLQYDEQMLKKMRQVFRIFRENRDEVALLWRPHPLIPNTIRSMRPQLWAAYAELVNDYRQEGWGIYDDTADMDRAVVLSDGYYGDASSVVQLYQKTGKPVMLQNANAADFNWDELLFGKGIAADGKNLYMALVMINAIVQVDLRTGEMKRCADFGNVYLNKYNHTYIYTDIETYGNRLFFAPTRANSMAVFDKKANKIEIRALNIPNKFLKGIPNYAISVKNAQEILFIGVCQTNSIVRWNIETEKVDFYGQIINENSKLRQKAVYGRNAVIVDECLYVPLLDQGSLYELDLRTGEERILCIDSKGRGNVTINVWSGNFYITTNSGELLKWKNGVTEERRLPNNGEFYTSFCMNGMLWLFPRNPKESILKVNLIKDEVEKISFSHIVYDVKADESTGKLLMNTRGGIARLDPDTNGIERINYKVSGIVNHRQIIEQWSDETDFKREKIEGCPEYNTLQRYISEIRGDRIC